MKRKTLRTLAFSLILLVFAAASCQSETSKKEAQAKADSLETQTQHAMDSSEKAIMEQMNMVPDSEIVNDSNAPVKKKENGGK